MDNTIAVELEEMMYEQHVLIHGKSTLHSKPSKQVKDKVQSLLKEMDALSLTKEESDKYQLMMLLLKSYK